jgi:mannose-6-phosphate isomerase-like protein (cupin superfamily)
MARKGDELFNPVTKTRVVFVEVPADNDGRELAVDWHVPPGETLPVAPHYHAGPTGGVAETFTFISGSATMKVGGRKLTISAPSTIEVRFNEVHTHPANAGDGELHVRQSGTRDLPEPEMLGRVEQFLETLVALSQQGKVNRKGDITNPLQAALTINDLLLAPTFLPILPRGFQKAAFGALARIARRGGYRAYHRPRALG